MPDPSSEINPLDELAEEFVERYRRGEALHIPIAAIVACGRKPVTSDQ